MAKMSVGDLKALLSAERYDALSAMAASKISDERASALNYYMGNMSKDMPAPDGRSKAVSSDVADTIEGLMPPLMDIFASGDEVVQFAPVGPEDVAAAEQETDYVNHVFMQQNPGFLILYSFIKDALLSKVGVVKVFWERRALAERETYLDLDAAAFAVLAGDPEVEIVEHTVHAADVGAGLKPAPTVTAGAGSLADGATPLPQGSPQGEEAGGAAAPSAAEASSAPATLHDVTVVTRRTREAARVEPVPPEEFGISRHARSLRDADYCFHAVVRSEARLVAEGYDREQIERLPSYAAAHTIEEQARDSVDESTLRQGADGERGNRLIRVTEHYLRMDYEGGPVDEDGRERPGEPELYRVVTGGDDGEVLTRDGEPAVFREDMIPFAAMTPVIITHRFFGRSIADLVMDIQEVTEGMVE